MHLKAIGAAHAVSAALALFLAFAPPARSEITPEAAKVVARYVEATGGAAGLAAEQTTYTRAIVRGFGFTGLVETWSARPDRHYSRTELGRSGWPRAATARRAGAPTRRPGAS